MTMLNRKKLELLTIKELIKEYSFLEDYFKDNLINIENKQDLTLIQLLDSIDKIEKEENTIDDNQIIENIINYTNQMIEFLGMEDNKVKTLTIYPGYNKYGEKENYDKIDVHAGEIICIVGPTGSGKSRLLADIEWAAQGDTPTKRIIHIDNNPVDIANRFSAGNKLVAQLSQNMNFVMDLTVYEFLKLHAQSRMVENDEEIVEKIIIKANELAGEKFTRDTPITSLSGGQSRALMIADTAILSSSPIVLIDEIENAGIDRKKALELLVGEEKIVIMATHDPILALMGNKRIVINNGGIAKIIDVTEKERSILSELEKLDKIMQDMRNKLRYGKEITLDKQYKF